MIRLSLSDAEGFDKKKTSIANGLNLSVGKCETPPLPHEDSGGVKSGWLPNSKRPDGKTEPEELTPTSQEERSSIRNTVGKDLEHLPSDQFCFSFFFLSNRTTSFWSRYETKAQSNKKPQPNQIVHLFFFYARSDCRKQCRKAGREFEEKTEAGFVSFTLKTNK